MFAIDDATAVAVMPTPEAAGTPGFFTEGNPGLGVAATYVRASFLNALQQELLNLLSGAGITPSKTAYDQLLTGLRSNALVTGNATGAANTYAVAYTPAITALVDGMVLWFKASATNTGASTLNINAVGAKAIVGGAHLALQGGEIILNGRCLVVWNAALNSWVLIECTGAALQVGAATQSQHAMQLGQATGRALRTSVYKLISGVQNVSVNGGAFTPTGAGTFTALAATNFIRVRVLGGGGGGGGAAATAAGQYAAAAGGTGAAYGEGIYTTGFSSLTITVGAKGTGAAAGNNTGNNGGASSAGALLSSPGGPGGAGGPANAVGNGSVVDLAPSSAPTGANLVSRTGAGGGFRFFLSTGQYIGSRGGAAGNGGPGPAMQNNGAGLSATNPGAGGSGATLGASLSAAGGGDGGDGEVTIEEFA